MSLELEPCTEYDTVCREIDKTAQAFDLAVRFGTPPFYNVKDVSASLRRAASGSRISLKELLEIKSILGQITALSDWYSHCENIQTDLDYLFSSLRPNKYLYEKLDRSIISEDEISDAASPELAAIRKKISRAGSKLRDTLDKMIKSESVQKALQENIVTMRDGRYVLPVKAEHRGKIQGLIHSSSATGQTIFIEPMAVVEANNDIRMLESQEQEEIDRILTELCRECGEFSEEIIGGYEVCTELNLYFAKANLGAKMKASVPEVTCDGKLHLNKARHPLLDPKKAVPIDISLGEDYQALIITGPNTGGKIMREIVDRMESTAEPPASIQQKLLELATELHTVSGKKQYGYLKKPLKDMVDSIVDELEKLPEVAAYYSVWNGLRDTLEGYYKSKPRQHNPLTQQKEFRAIKNAIIQEAERLRQQMEQAQTASEQKPSQEAEAPSGETSADTSANPTLANENTSSATSYSVRLPSEYLLNSTVRLFHQVGQIFRDNAAPPSNPMGIRIDSKRRKKLMQKRLAMGHKQDDHEQEQDYGQVIR